MPVIEQPKFYIEWWVLGDESKNVAANTFSMPVKNLKYFLKTFAESGKYIVHVEMLTPIRKVVYTKRPANHLNKVA